MRKIERDFSYGYKDERFVRQDKFTGKKAISIILAVCFIFAVWLFLDYKILVGEEWLSPTYDNEDWRTNEGNLHTFGMWDLETHVWKTQFIMENFPNVHWNPYWYLGMPLFEYYQNGFYVLHLLTILITSTSAAKAANLLIIFSHLIAVLLTFFLCYKISKKPWASALVSILLFASTFMTLRSYGWEPITVIFIFLYPLTLLVFLREPLRPLRLSVILLLAATYLSHPLIFFALAMTMGLYLISIAVREGTIEPGERQKHYIWQYFGALVIAILIGAVQFFPQISYAQATSGAHMGVSYIPFYHIPFNIITLQDFLFDAGNLKGPGLSIMIAISLVIVFFIFEKRFKNKIPREKRIIGNPLVSGFLLVLVTMILFYYLERFNIFPMNILRSIQYHRIIPEFIIAACVLTAAISNLIYTKWQKTMYYGIIFAFAIASLIVVYNVQTHWETSSVIENKPEFIYDEFDGRISFPYTDQSLAVRSSFTEIPQAYGYYEQGITNAYNDEIFSVSSGFHTAEITILYLKAANVGRLYINTEEGERDELMRSILEQELEFNHQEGERYGYFEIPLKDASLVQAVSRERAEEVLEFEPQCRIMFKDKYCGSAKEEFVDTDPEEINYLEEYVGMIEEDYPASARTIMENPQLYTISVQNAEQDTAVVMKMNYDNSFRAYVDGEEIEIDKIGPDFMILYPEKTGNYDVELKYSVGRNVFFGAIVSVVSLIFTLFYFALGKRITRDKWFRFKEGDL